MTLAALGIEAKTDGVEKSTDQLDRLAGAAGKAETATDKLAPSSRKAGESVKGLGGEARTAEGALAKMAGSLGSVIGKFAAMAAAAVSVGALFALARKGANDIDDAAKAARRLGASILGFRALELAAGEAGVSVSSLADAVQTMDRELARGSANAVSALSKIGLTVKDIVGLDADQKIALIGDKIKEFGLSSGQASAMLQDFGIRNKEFLLAVTDGGNALRAARADIDDYGLAISQVDSDRIETANDAIGRLALAGQYLAQQLALALMPALGDLAKVITDSLREGGLLRSMIDGLVSVVKFGAENFGMIASAIAVMASTAIPAAVGGLVALAGGFTTAGIAARAMGIAMTLAGGPWGIVAGAAAALGIALYNVFGNSKDAAQALNDAKVAQDALSEAAAKYYDNMTKDGLDAMVKRAQEFGRAQAEALAASVPTGIFMTTQDEMRVFFETTNDMARTYIGLLDEMQNAATLELQLAAAEELQASVLSLTGGIGNMTIAQLDFYESLGLAVERMRDANTAATDMGTVLQEIVVPATQQLTAEQEEALMASNEMMRSYQNRAALAETELRYGRESAQYLSQQLNQERQIQFAKIAALDITNQQKEAARRAYDQMVMAEAKTRGWNVELNTTNTRLNSAYQALVKIRDTQPGSGWLSTAIQKAATLATTLWDAVAANSALSNLSVSEGPGMTTGNSDWAKNSLGFTKPGSELIYTPPKTSGGGGGGGGGGPDGALQGLMSRFEAERDALNTWYLERQELIQSFTDQELEQLGGRNLVIQQMNAEHNLKMRELNDRERAYEISAQSSMFSTLAGLLSSFGQQSKAAQIAALAINTGLRIRETLQNAASASVRALAELGPIAGPPAAAKIMAYGKLQAALIAAQGIASAGSGGRGGGGGSASVGASTNDKQQSAPETPLRVTLDTIDPGSIYSGAAMIKMFEAIQKEAGNRGIVWVPAGA